MNWTLIKYLLGKAAVSRRRLGPRMRPAPRLRLGTLCLLSLILGYAAVSAGPGMTPRRFGEALRDASIALGCMIALIYPAFSMLTTIARERQARTLDLLLVALGSARGLCATLALPRVATTGFIVLSVLPPLAAATALGALTLLEAGGIVLALLSFLLAWHAFLLFASTFFTRQDNAVKTQGFLAAILIGSLLCTHISAQTWFGLPKFIRNHWQAIAAVCLAVAAVSFEAAACRVNSIANPSARRPAHPSRRRRRVIRGSNPIKELILAGETGRRSILDSLPLRTAFGVILALIALIPFYGWMLIIVILMGRIRAALKSARPRDVWADVLLTSAGHESLGRTVFNTFLRRNLIILPALFAALCSTAWFSLEDRTVSDGALEAFLAGTFTLTGAVRTFAFALSALAMALAVLFYVTAGECQFITFPFGKPTPSRGNAEAGCFLTAVTIFAGPLSAALMARLVLTNPVDAAVLSRVCWACAFAYGVFAAAAATAGAAAYRTFVNDFEHFLIAAPPAPQEEPPQT